MQEKGVKNSLLQLFGLSAVMLTGLGHNLLVMFFAIISQLFRTFSGRNSHPLAIIDCQIIIGAAKTA